VSRRSELVFLLLVVLQAAHSAEEYAAGLYEVLAPARFLSGLVSDDPAAGFAIINSALVAFGFWCYLVPIRSGRSSARAWAWPWIAVELANGIGHVALALLAGGYFPGVLTAPFLFATAASLAVLLKRDHPMPRRAVA
jgi:Protein of unknown function with HXXEE motif